MMRFVGDDGRRCVGREEDGRDGEALQVVRGAWVGVMKVLAVEERREETVGVGGG